MADEKKPTCLRQVWRERATDMRRVSLHVDEWQRRVFAEAFPELVTDGASESVTLDAELTTRVRTSHLGVWETRAK